MSPPSPKSYGSPGKSRPECVHEYRDIGSPTSPLCATIDEDTIPSGSRGRNIIICLDGTHNSFCETNSNVVKLFELLEKSDRQLCYYDSGIGTQQGPWLYGLKKRIAMLTDYAFAWNFHHHVIQAYKFVMDQYQDGDKLWLFGFSRGSYAARALAGMIQYIGLLPKGNHSQVPLAWSVYAQSANIPFSGSPFVPIPSPKDTKVKQPGSSTQYAGTPQEYKRIFSRSAHIPIEFVGVWDTVSALGITRLPNLPFATAVGYVRYFRQALSLDERRAKFVPEYYHEESEPGENEITQPLSKGVINWKQVLTNKDNGHLKVKEVWFLGCHSDVGGGNTINGLPSLANVPLRWMIYEGAVLGLKIDNHALFSSKIYNNSAYPTVRRIIPPRYISVEDIGSLPDETDAFLRYKSTSDDVRAIELIKRAAEFDAEPHLDLVQLLPLDLRQPKKESLKGAYWLLEFLWLERWDYIGANRRKLVKSRNKGKGREIISQQRIHRSVLNRLAHELAVQEARRIAAEAAAAADHGSILHNVKSELTSTLHWAQKFRLGTKRATYRPFEFPKATFADGRTWESILGLPCDDDFWEFVKTDMTNKN